jgi:hypothetical protein
MVDNEPESSALVTARASTVVLPVPAVLWVGEEVLTTSKAMVARNFGKLASLE